MCNVSFDIPNDVLNARNVSKEQASGFVRARFAAALYLEGGISMEYAAKIAALSIEDFSALLSVLRPEDGDAGNMRDDAAMDWLMNALDKGVQSGQTHGWLSEEEVNARFERRRAEILTAKRA